MTMHLWSRLRIFLGDGRGVAAVEFAFIAPVMILLYFGLAEFCQALMAERKAIRAASSVGDLIAQTEAITPTGSGGVDDVFAIAQTVMAPFPATSTRLKICVASLSGTTVNNALQVAVDWSRNSGDSSCPAKGSIYTQTPSDLIATGQSLIMSRVKYEYESPVKVLLKSNPTFDKIYYLRPRRSPKVVCSAC